MKLKLEAKHGIIDINEKGSILHVIFSCNNPEIY